MEEKMQQRRLGQSGPEVSALGYGAMVLVHGMYGEVEDERSVATIRHALDAGITLIDTSDAYGADGHNERLVGRAISDRREGVVVATKFGYALSPDEPGTPVEVNWDVESRVNGRPEWVGRKLDRSLERLGVEYVDLWYLHFPDPSVPIEETVGTMAEAVESGKARHLGLCNVTAEQLRRAHAVHPIAAVQNEYSLWTRDAEAEVLPACRELGVGFVPWAPLGSGFLSGQVGSIGSDDFRSRHPRFRSENLQQNVDRFAPLRGIAEELGISPAQLALAWLLAQGEDIVPIPGTRNPDHIDSNVAAAEVRMGDEHLRRIDEAAPAGLAAGEALL
jgi:aryl-alcohol dehydrogenase-like predicted oxidoreductase